MLKKWISAGIIILIAVLSGLLSSQTTFIQSLELKAFDIRAQLKSKYNPSPVSKDIVIVLIDDSSLKTMAPIIGRWPWPRAIYSELFQYLAESGAKQILVDILFTETQENRNENDELGNDDISLVESSIEHPEVIHAFQLLHDRETDDFINKPLPKDFISKFKIQSIQTNFQDTPINNHYYIPFTELWQYSSQLGVVEIKPDFDGVYRKTNLIREYQGNYYSSFSYASLQSLFPTTSVTMTKNQLQIGTIDIPLIDNAQFLFNMKTNFDSYTAASVFASIQAINQGNYDSIMVPPETFKDKIVLIGASAVGTYDLVTCSLGPNIPGVFIHASIIDNVLNRSFYRVLNQRYIITAVIILCSIITLSVLFISQTPIQIIIIASCLISFTVLNNMIFIKQLLWVKFVFPTISLLMSTLLGYGYLAATEGRAKRKVRKMLSQYVSPSVLTEVMDKQDDVITPEVGAKETLTVFFSDIRSFTSLSESLDAEQIVEMLNFYLDKMVEIVFKYKGTLDKFIGDAVMAFWGAPVKDPKHALQAVLCALEMSKALKEINAHFDEKGYPHFAIGMGLNTGEVILGNIGSEKKLDYTVIGDNVNLGSRIEGLTKPYGCEIIISESTKEQLPDTIICRIVDLVTVKGKTKPIRIYNPLIGPDEPETIKQKMVQIANEYETAFTLYTSQEFNKALTLYEKLAKSDPQDKLAPIYIERCQSYLKSPPDQNWDGVNTLTTK